MKLQYNVTLDTSKTHKQLNKAELRVIDIFHKKDMQRFTLTILSVG